MSRGCTCASTFVFSINKQREKDRRVVATMTFDQTAWFIRFTNSNAQCPLLSIDFLVALATHALLHKRENVVTTSRDVDQCFSPFSFSSFSFFPLPVFLFFKKRRTTSSCWLSSHFLQATRICICHLVFDGCLSLCFHNSSRSTRHSTRRLSSNLGASLF